MNRFDQVSDEMLMALADGELSETEARVLRELIAADPDLAARYADFEMTRNLLQDAFEPGPVPQKLVVAVHTAAVSNGVGGAVVAFPQGRAARIARWGAGLAASVVLALGGFWAGRGSIEQVAATGPEAAAIALVGVATGGEAVLADGSRVRALGSFETEAGLCRLIGQDATRHVACRADPAAGWTIALSVSYDGLGAYVPASDIATGLIDRLLDDIGAGPALTPEQEATALRP